MTGTQHRSRTANMKEALDELLRRLRELNRIPKKRIPTHKGRGVKRREVEARQRQSEKKRERKRVDREEG